MVSRAISLNTPPSSAGCGYGTIGARLYDMKMSYRLILIALLSAAAAMPVLGNNQSPDSLPNQQAAATADQALALALKYTGFSKLAGFSATAQPQPELVWCP